MIGLPNKAIALLLLLLTATAALARDYTNLTLEQAIDLLEAQGLSIFYSSDLVKADMRVLTVPAATAPREILQEIVRPHGIAVADGPNGALLLVRAVERPMPTTMPRFASPPVMQLTEIIVTASRYELVRLPQPSITSLTATELQLIPNLGDDPLRTIARLPGTGGSELSAKLNVRGGATDETLIRFDGLRLANPFHLKDFQSVFSAIDPAVVGTIDVYTGGFPVSFGDRMSGVIDIRPLRSDASSYREISLSLFNASAMAAGRFNAGRGDWAVSARRGNLDLVLDMSNTRLGHPVYSDVYAHAGQKVSQSLAIAGNFLQFNDDILLTDDDSEEQARADYRDRYLWLRIDQQLNADLSGSLLLARTDLDSTRSGSADQPGISHGTLSDRREFTIQSLQGDWSWRVAPAMALQFGGEWRHSTGRYDYQDEVDFDLVFIAPGASTARSRTRQLSAHRRGDQYGMYAALRTEFTPAVIADAGVRWDRSTLSQGDEQLSPRANLLYRVADSTWLRASWGRFFQTQAINELQISDGVVEFSAAQRADHWLASIEHRFGNGVDLRLEMYRKDYNALMPRYENLLNTAVILPELKPDRIRIATGHGNAEGVELSVRSMQTRPVFWWLSYTWSQVNDEFQSRETRRSWDQTHAWSGGIGWESQHWELSLAATYHTGWPTTAVVLIEGGDAPVALAGPINARRLHAYADVDARVARRFPLQGADSLTLFFELSNVLNRRNDCCIEYDVENEDEGEITLDIETVRSLPLLPSVGFVWRF